MKFFIPVMILIGSSLIENISFLIETIVFLTNQVFANIESFYITFL